jgi:hypothetical protein
MPRKSFVGVEVPSGSAMAGNMVDTERVYIHPSRRLKQLSDRRFLIAQHGIRTDVAVANSVGLVMTAYLSEQHVYGGPRTNPRIRDVSFHRLNSL